MIKILMKITLVWFRNNWTVVKIVRAIIVILYVALCKLDVPF